MMKGALDRDATTVILLTLVSHTHATGAQFTGPLEGMINDLSVGSESHKEFENAMQKLPEGLPIKGDGNFTVQVSFTCRSCL